MRVKYKSGNDAPKGGKTGNYIYAEDLDGLRNYYNVGDNFDTIIDKINYILKNKAELAQQDGWNLFDALKEIVDSMETIKAFEDMELYHQVISKIDYVVEEDINFSNLYDSYGSSDKGKPHTRWPGLIKFRRIKTIDSIRNS